MTNSYIQNDIDNYNKQAKMREDDRKLGEYKTMYPKGTRIAITNLEYSVPIVVVEAVYRDGEDIVVQYKLNDNSESVVSLVKNVMLANDTYKNDLKGYSELNLLVLWAKDNEDALRAAGLSVDLLKALIEEFRSRK